MRLSLHDRLLARRVEDFFSVFLVVYVCVPVRSLAFLSASTFTSVSVYDSASADAFVSSFVPAPVRALASSVLSASAL